MLTGKHPWPVEVLFSFHCDEEVDTVVGQYEGVLVFENLTTKEKWAKRVVWRWDDFGEAIPV